MSLSVFRGVVERCMLLNYRLDLEVAKRLIPSPFQPRAWGPSALCTISWMRLRQLRPRFLPAVWGMSSENVACRIAVHWRQRGKPREGLLALRQDTSSRFNTLLTSRMFSAVQHHARFTILEEDHRYTITVDSDDKKTHLHVVASLAPQMARSSVFRSLAEAAEFFRRATRVSATSRLGQFEGLELKTHAWQPLPLLVESLDCSYFRTLMPEAQSGITFDSALLLSEVEHQWSREAAIACEPAAVQPM